MQTKLVFVYNANSGLFNTVSDIAHKILSPKTYSCQLCSLTHGYFSVREEWVGFLKELDADCEFLHRDELKEKYQLDGRDLPAIYIRSETGDLNVFADRETIEACSDIVALKQMLQDKLQHLNNS